MSLESVPAWLPDRLAPLALTLDRGMRVRTLNQRVERLLERSADELVGTSLLTMVEPADVPLVLTAIDQVAAAPRTASLMMRLRGADGRSLPSLWSVHAAGPDHPVELWGRDESLEELLRARLSEVNLLVGLASGAAQCGVWRWNLATGSVELDAEAGLLFGIDPSRTVGTIAELAALLAPRTAATLGADLLRDLREGGIDRVVELADGELLRLAGEALERDHRGRPLRVSGVVWTVERQRKEEHLLDLVSVDELTGLANRRAFNRAVRSECRRADDGRLDLTLALIDLDDLKVINDRSGHLAGDTALQLLANRLRRSFRSGLDKVFRWGGDEFAALLPGVDALQGRTAVERVVAQLRELPFTVSVGIADLGPGDEVETLLRHADAALYLAKQEGKNQVRVHESTPSTRRALP